MTSGEFIHQWVELLSESGVDLRAWSLAWARALPVVMVVPAFGLRALPRPVQALMAIAIAGCSLSARGTGGSGPELPWAWQLGIEVFSGLTVALSASIALWVATMVGGVMDAVRGAADTVLVPAVEGRPTLFGVPMALTASAVFLATGGPARVVVALSSSRAPDTPALLQTSLDLAAGVHVAVAIAAPVLAASVVVELAAALIARSASPAQIHVLLAPLRSFVLLAVAALTWDRMVQLLAALIQARPST